MAIKLYTISSLFSSYSDQELRVYKHITRSLPLATSPNILAATHAVYLAQGADLVDYMHPIAEDLIVLPISSEYPAQPVGLVLEQCQGTIAGLLAHTPSDLPFSDLATYFSIALRTLYLLHEYGVCHNDLHLGNLFLCQDPSTWETILKIGDFDTSKLCSLTRSQEFDEFYFLENAILTIFSIEFPVCPPASVLPRMSTGVRKVFCSRVYEIYLASVPRTRSILAVADLFADLGVQLQ